MECWVCRCQIGSSVQWNSLKIHLGTSFLHGVLIYTPDTSRVSMLMKFMDENLKELVVEKQIMPLYEKD